MQEKNTTWILTRHLQGCASLICLDMIMLFSPKIAILARILYVWPQAAKFQSCALSPVTRQALKLLGEKVAKMFVQDLCVKSSIWYKFQTKYKFRLWCRSVVVAIRGTWSMEDIITDSVASAECLKDWLPPGTPHFQATVYSKYCSSRDDKNHPVG